MPPRLLQLKAPRLNSIHIKAARFSRLSPRLLILARQTIMTRDLRRTHTNGGLILVTATVDTYSGIARESRHGKLPPEH